MKTIASLIRSTFTLQGKIALVLVFVLLIITVRTVYAVTAYNPDYAYSSDAWAASSFTELASNYACNIHSYMDPAVTIQVIG